MSWLRFLFGLACVGVLCFCLSVSGETAATDTAPKPLKYEFKAAAFDYTNAMDIERKLDYLVNDEGWEFMFTMPRANPTQERMIVFRRIKK